MSPDLVQRVHDCLEAMPIRGLEAAKQLFWSELNYERADEPLPLSPFSDSERAYLQGAPTILAEAGAAEAPMRIIHVTLSDEAQGRGFPLSIAAERAIIERLLPDHPYALFLFSDPQQQHWHLVNVRDVRGGQDGADGSLRYLMRRIAVGPDERLRTAAERVAMLDVAAVRDGTLWREVSAADLQARHNEAFDVEQVTKKFYDDYKCIFMRLRKHVEAYLPSAEQTRDYAQQFLNRLMFLHFVQRKGWLGGDRDFLSNYWRAYAAGNHTSDTFFRDWLQVLFFEAMNKQFQYGRHDRQYLPERFREDLALAPYLNGSLFAHSALDRDFADEGGDLPDALVDSVMTTLDRYNFTIAEDTPLDQEVAVDPEMLGYVYESLVNVSDDTDERGDAGIYYTPRIEIELMCRLSLVERLTKALGAQHRDLLYEALFALAEDEKSAADARLRRYELWPAIDVALEQLTVCDPACGSGSFLVGMLDVLADLQARSDAQHGRGTGPYERKKRIVERSLYGVDIKQWAVQVAALRLWLQLVIETDVPLEELQTKPLLPSLEFKLRTGDSLVQRVGGIDLAHRGGSTAISPALKRRLTQLRGRKTDYFAASASGDARQRERRAIEDETRQIYIAILQERMANLSRQIDQVEARLAPHKDIFGDTVPEQLDLNRGRLREQRDDLGQQHADTAVALRALRTAGELPFVWDVDFVEVFEGDGGGFDIVIGNPPYESYARIKDPCKLQSPAEYKLCLRHMLASRWPKSNQALLRHLSGRSDLYVYFYLLGLDLLEDSGSLCFVTSNAWLDADYGDVLQEFCLTRSRVRFVIDNETSRSFANADINTVVALLDKPVDSSTAVRDRLDNICRFVMICVPFEIMLDPIPWEEIEAAEGRCTYVEYRVHSASQRWLLEQGSETTSQRYAGDKWGGKYLRAPDIMWHILDQASDRLRRLCDIAEILGYVHDNNTGSKYPEKPFVRSVQVLERTLVRRNDSVVMAYGVKTTASTQRVAPILFPRTIGERHIVPFCPDEVVFKEFYRILPPEGLDISIAAQLNSSFGILQRELWGIVALGQGGLKFNVTSVGCFRILPLLPSSEVRSLFLRMAQRPSMPIADELVQTDRLALDAVIFDALGLSRNEREALYKAVNHLVNVRLKKARSV